MFGITEKKPQEERLGDPLDQVLLGFSGQDVFTIRDACEGIQIFGGIGSGKTSGSGAFVARSFLQAGFGGVVLTAKPDEPDLWRRYAKETGRLDDLVYFGPSHLMRFNALDYECKRPGVGGGITENLVGLFDTLVQVAKGGNSGQGGGGENEAFWRNEQRKLVRNAIDGLRLAGIPISFQTIYRFIITAATEPSQLKNEEWRRGSFCFKVMRRASRRAQAKRFTSGDRNDCKICSDFWTREFPNQAERTRSTVVSTFTGMADVFLRGVLRQLFNEGSTLSPECTFAGKIIILDLPQKLFNEVGVYAQVLFKYCWQRAVERRTITADSLPVFLWADEAQHFVNEHDVNFQTTARSSRVCTVFLTQNLPNYLFTLGGNARGRALVDSLLGNLVTKIFHNNTCAATNQYAANLFAQDWQQDRSQSYAQKEKGFNVSNSVSQKLQYVVQPREFSGLMKGGPENDFLVEAIIHQGGKRFNTGGLNALLTEFRQTSNHHHV